MSFALSTKVYMNNQANLIKMAPKLWNNLPKNIRSIIDFDKFKSMLKTHLFDNY